ncbi:MAG: DUF58 domain-containing protein [Deltaproteobacteria bacterium CG_4_9_14_3_um_filter_63_12]|nr:MAG: DUF58 domain-containing protein [Deltaproteobacteria bacterium CG_4_9_14_3_um_filter_63_12]
MLRPTRTCIALAVLAAFMALLPAVVSPSLWGVVVAFDAVLFALMALDAIFAPSAGKTKVKVKAPALLYLGTEDTLDVTVRLGLARPGFDIEVRADLVGPARSEAILKARTGSQGTATAKFPVKPWRRGTVRCEAVWVRWTGPMGLMSRSTKRAVQCEVAVVPNVKAVREAALRLTKTRDFMAGVKRQRYIGDGSEFESLREYQPGYDHRAIDWKSSARRRKLLVKEYQAERNHRVILAFDTGYLMSQELGELPRLDHAINAGLLLALLSLKMGDRVGLFGFDSAVRAYTSPQPGVHTIHRLMEQSAKLEYSSNETNFTLGLAELSARVRRRSIVVVLTDFSDPVTAENMVANLGQMARRHLVIFVAMRDEGVEAVARAVPNTFGDLNRAVVAGELERDRELVLQHLRRAGVFCIDAAPREITVQLLNRYLEVKRRGLV